MKFVDAHIHLADEEYAGSIDAILQDARDSNVVALISNSMDLKTCVGSLELAKRFPNNVYAALGVHPWTVRTITEDELKQTIDFILQNSGNASFVAIGEIGLDNKYMDVWDRQVKVLDAMLHLAEKLGLPVEIHSRGTTAQIVDMLSSYSVKKVLLHWFSGPISTLTMAMDRGFYVSEGAPVAFSDEIRDIVRVVSLNRLLTETDGPVRFSRPPFKGKKPTPAFIPMIVNAIADVVKMDVGSIADRVGRNFEDFFGIKVN